METYYGQAAKDMFAQIKASYTGDNGGDDKKEKEKPKGYFSTLWHEMAKGDPFGNVGRTWRGWLSEDSTLGEDLWNSFSNSFWGVASLLDGNTYVDFYEGQKAYWSSSAEDKAKADAIAVNNFVEGAATAAPLAYISPVKSALTFEGNGGYGYQIGKFELMYKNPRAGGGTILSYKGKSGKNFRIDYHRIKGVNKEKKILHYHTSYNGLPLGVHRRISFNFATFGQPIKKK